MTEHADRLSEGFDRWLRREVIESNQGRNNFLDDYAYYQGRRTQAGLDENPGFLKAQAHNTRYKLLLDNFDALDGEPSFTAKLIHHSLMYVSGGFRDECLLKAHNQSEYEVLRFGNNGRPGGATSVDIAAEVRAAQEAGHIPAKRVTELSRELNEEVHTGVAKLYEWLSENPAIQLGDIKVSDEPLQLVTHRQAIGIQLAGLHALHWMNTQETTLEAVPIMEAKSITDAELTNLGQFVAEAA